MTEQIEVQNMTLSPILASACRSKFSGKLYVHIGMFHGGETEVRSGDYAIVEVKPVEF
jgi:hypothetical protein